MKRFSVASIGFVVTCLSSTQAAHADDGVLDFSLAANYPASAASKPASIAQASNANPPVTKPPVVKPIELAFDPSPRDHVAASATAIAAPAPSQSTTTDERSPLFADGTNSLVAKAVGSAEGTRTPEGDRTWAYYGHVDPGNGAWNLGSFSYQHGAKSPEDADNKQLSRLQDQANVLKQQAAEQGMELTLEEELNGIDLANQAPAAALNRGYVQWLKQAHDLGMDGTEAILWARTRSFLDPDSGRWNAPGLGNTIDTIAADQERRIAAIRQAIAAYQPRSPVTLPSQTTQSKLNSGHNGRSIAEQIISFDLSIN
jgi:hypothetical protein